MCTEIGLEQTDFPNLLGRHGKDSNVIKKQQNTERCGEL